MSRAPPPDECESEIEHLRRMATARPHRRAQVATHRVGKSVLSYCAILRPRDAERRTFMYWMKAKTVTTQQHCAAFQKVRILFAIGLSLIRHQCILG
jgi:hypothetical protein